MANSGSIATNSQGGSPQAGLILSGDGLAGPQAGLILSGETLYGTAHKGGSSGMGMAFALSTDGTGFTNLHSFTLSDGAEPQAGLILSGNTLYGTAHIGGRWGKGTVFAGNIDGTGFTNLHSFTGGKDGAIPQVGLILSGNTLYGTAVDGGNSGAGTVFTLNTDNMGFNNFHSFNGADGAWPEAGLILSGNTLYGTTFYGGDSKGGSNDGIVFKLKTNGKGFTILYSFTRFNHAPPYANGDGARPMAEMILSGNILYGMTSQGGSSGAGTVFAVNTDGTGFTNLYSFTGGKDGASPRGGLILSGNILYGTTQLGLKQAHWGSGEATQGKIFDFRA